MTPAAKTQLVQTLARELGFDLVGVAPTTPLRRAAYYRQWLAAGYGGSMGYLGRNVPMRAEPERLLAGAKSIICVAINYRQADGYLGSVRALQPPPDIDGQPVGVIAQYARLPDYHVLLRRRLQTLVERLRGAQGQSFEARVFVDTGPLLEKELAAAAGLGWIGRNTCLLNPKLGSYLLLGEVVTTLVLERDAPLRFGCGKCKRCLQACPTNAFIAPGRLDASRCISYLTIEHRDEIASAFHAAMGRRVFGCDICQQVCPYNAAAPCAREPSVLPPAMQLSILGEVSFEEYRQTFHRSAAKRAKVDMWRRNARICSDNTCKTKK